MSHFTVAIRVPGHISNVQEHVDDMLRIYNEQGNPEDDFMEFLDKTEELQEEYDTESSEQVLYEGTYYYPYQFKKLFGVNEITDDLLKEKSAKLVERKHSEIYKTFEEFTKEYHGMEPKENGKYGYYRNPNAKWDWWTIGGRWTGHWHAKKNVEGSLGKPGAFDNEPTEGGLDIIRIKDIDFARAEKETQERVQKFLVEYKEYFETGKEDERNPFNGPRAKGLDIGLVDCFDEDQITDEMRSTCKLVKWGRQNVPGKDRYDVLKPLPETPEFLDMLTDYFNTIGTFARLDDKGWAERGTMGWFGMSSATPESNEKFLQSFMPWLKSGNQEDWVVCVDCHI